jgi:UDP-N-acetyl-D-glucosamine dehydrogenase
MLWSDCSHITAVELLPERLSNYDCVLIAADHTSYDYEAIVRNSMLAVDTRNATRHTKQNRNKVAHC